MTQFLLAVPPLVLWGCVVLVILSLAALVGLWKWDAPCRLTDWFVDESG